MEFLVGQLVAPGLVVCPTSIVDENDKLRAEVEALKADNVGLLQDVAYIKEKTERAGALEIQVRDLKLEVEGFKELADLIAKDARFDTYYLSRKAKILLGLIPEKPLKQECEHKVKTPLHCRDCGQIF